MHANCMLNFHLHKGQQQQSKLLHVQWRKVFQCPSVVGSVCLYQRSSCIVDGQPFSLVVGLQKVNFL